MAWLFDFPENIQFYSLSFKILDFFLTTNREGKKFLRFKSNTREKILVLTHFSFLCSSSSAWLIREISLLPAIESGRKRIVFCWREVTEGEEMNNGWGKVSRNGFFAVDAAHFSPISWIEIEFFRVICATSMKSYYSLKNSLNFKSVITSVWCWLINQKTNLTSK